jgi:hypothetical protein
MYMACPDERLAIDFGGDLPRHYSRFTGTLQPGRKLSDRRENHCSCDVLKERPHAEYQMRLLWNGRSVC